MKSSIRNSTLAGILALALAVGLGWAVGQLGAGNKQGADPNPKATAFLASKFVNGQYLEGLTPGKPDYGFSFEGLIQLAAAGGQDAVVKSASKHLVLGYADSAVFRIPAELLDAGLAGKYLFVAKAVDKKPDGIEGIWSKYLPTSNSGTTLNTSSAYTFDYAWSILGLAAWAQYEGVNNVVGGLLELQLNDGGFGSYLPAPGAPAVSAADGTGIAIMALEAARGHGADDAKIDAALLKATNWLTKNAVNGDHFEAYGAADVNGTEYAIMGLAAVGAKTDSYVAWLQKQVVAGSGISSAYSAGKADVFATAQGLLALRGLSYLSLLK